MIALTCVKYIRQYVLVETHNILTQTNSSFLFMPQRKTLQSSIVDKPEESVLVGFVV